MKPKESTTRLIFFCRVEVDNSHNIGSSRRMGDKCTKMIKNEATAICSREPQKTGTKTGGEQLGEPCHLNQTTAGNWETIVEKNSWRKPPPKKLFGDESHLAPPKKQKTSISVCPKTFAIVMKSFREFNCDQLCTRLFLLLVLFLQESGDPRP